MNRGASARPGPLSFVARLPSLRFSGADSLRGRRPGMVALYLLLLFPFYLVDASFAKEKIFAMMINEIFARHDDDGDAHDAS